MEEASERRYLKRKVNEKSWRRKWQPRPRGVLWILRESLHPFIKIIPSLSSDLNNPAALQIHPYPLEQAKYRSLPHSLPRLGRQSLAEPDLFPMMGKDGKGTKAVSCELGEMVVKTLSHSRPSYVGSAGDYEPWH